MYLYVFYSAGGLVTAVAPVVIDCDGLWVGWTGLDNFNTGYALSELLISASINPK